MRSGSFFMRLFCWCSVAPNVSITMISSVFVHIKNSTVNVGSEHCGAATAEFQIDSYFCDCFSRCLALSIARILFFSYFHLHSDQRSNPKLIKLSNGWMKEKVNNVDKYESNDFLPIQTSSNEIIFFVYFATFWLWSGRTRRTLISMFV